MAGLTLPPAEPTEQRHEQRNDAGSPTPATDGSTLDLALTEVDAFLQETSDPAVFLLPSSKHAALCTQAIRAVYSSASTTLRDQLSNGKASAEMTVAQQDESAAPLPELYVDGFELEQIWHQLELQTQSLLRWSKRKIPQLLARDCSLLDDDMEDAVDDLLDGQVPSHGGEEGGSDESDGSGEDGTPEHGAVMKRSKKRKSVADIDYDEMLASHAGGPNEDARLEEGSNDEDGESDEDGLGDEGADAGLSDDDEGAGTAMRARVSQQQDEDDGSEDDEGAEEKAQVEDEFLQLDDMEAFVQQAEKSEALGDRGGLATLEGNDDALGGPEDDEDGDDDEDLFGPGIDDRLDQEGDMNMEGAEDMDDEEEMLDRALGGGKPATDIRYEDFFGSKAPHGRKRKRQAESAVRQVHSVRGDKGKSDSTEDGEADEAMLDTRNVKDDAGRGSSAKLPAGDDHEDEGLSTHEKRLKRVKAQMEELERAAMSEKEWQFRGEASARSRPVNSALEVDLDFEHTMRPPPAPTVEFAQSLEDMIKQRVLELRFDNVIRVLPAEPERKKVEVELDDSRSKAGLADLYEKDYLAATSGTIEDKHAKLRSEAKALFTALCAKLDSLSHLSFTPKPVLTDMEVKVDIPAIVMEETAPVTVSAANIRAPEELHAAKRAGANKGEAELTREERKQRRAKKKRISKRKHNENELKAGIATHVKGMKSAREDVQATRSAKADVKRRNSEKYAAAKTTSVFKKLAEEQAGAITAGARRNVVTNSANESSLKSSHLKM